MDIVEIFKRNKNATECPAGCYCGFTSLFTHLTIDCGATDVDDEKLFRQLNSLLSASHIAEHVTSLGIYNTPLTRVPTSVCQLLNLTSLHLDRNKLTQLPDHCFTKLTKLEALSVAQNFIVALQNGLFDGLQSLVSLNVSHNQVAFIGLRVFSNASDLTGLRSLDLGDNKLTSLEPWWYHRCIQGSKASPVSVILRDNAISNFTNKLRFNFQCGMKLPFGYVDLSNNQISHMMDVLQGWNITEIEKLICLNNVYELSQMNVNRAGTNYACDCIDFPIYKWAKLAPRARLLTGVYCTTQNFQTAFGQRLLASSIPLIEFVCDTSDHCPSGCRCVYRPENSTLHVYCSAANLSSLPLDLPPLPKKYVKYKLDFSNNKLLRRLERRPYFVNTSILEVSNCSLTEITVENLKDLSSLIIANFRGNMIQSFPSQADNVNISGRLLLGLNQWKCSCDKSWTIEWLQSLSDQISDPGEITCKSPARMYDRNVLKSTEYDFCVDPVKRTLKITLSAIAPIVAISVVLVILFHSPKLRRLFYKKFEFHPFDRDECIGEDMDYDVFLCCSSQDHRPHALRILDLIESKGYRVCYHERDFLPGQLITDNIGHSIERSKRTVCLLSNNFLQR